MAFTWVDWAIIALVAISSLISLRRGFFKEALSLLTWVVSGVVAWMFGGSLSLHLADYISTPSMRVIAACALLFIATLVVGAVVSFVVGELIKATGLSGTDRFLGMAFGAARGALLVVVVVGLLSLAPVTEDPWWQSSTLLPHFLLVADWSKNMIVGLSEQWVVHAANPAVVAPLTDTLLQTELQ